jgi:uncharacterized protein (DUF433 family)
VVSEYDEGIEPTSTHTPGLSPESGFIPVIAEHIGVRPGYCGGEPHILGHRVKVKHVAVWHERAAMTPAEIVATYPTLTLAQVHAALAYYYDHREEIQEVIAEEDRFVEEVKAKSGPSLLQENPGDGMPRTIRFHPDEHCDPASLPLSRPPPVSHPLASQVLRPRLSGINAASDLRIVSGERS